ncbi:integrase, catalytic region, zinc finger, CCHC-type containing protein [Tanacetum coccineum]
MKLEQFQVNIKFLNSLPPEWSKFVNDVKVIQLQFSPSLSPPYGSIHPTQHYSTTYPSTPLAITYPSTPYPNAYSSTVHQDIDSGLAVPVFKQGDDPIDAINKNVVFMCVIVLLHWLLLDHGLNISRIGGNNFGQQRVMKCFNCQGEGHMARQCPKPKRKMDATWFRDKISTAKAVFMANLSSYDQIFSHENEITSDSNIISYSQYLLETENAAVQDTNSSTQQDA